MEIQVEFPMDQRLFRRILWGLMRRTFLLLWCFAVEREGTRAASGTKQPQTPAGQPPSFSVHTPFIQGP